jgi:hypothetical protein
MVVEQFDKLTVTPVETTKHNKIFRFDKLSVQKKAAAKTAASIYYVKLLLCSQCSYHNSFNGMQAVFSLIKNH